MRVIFRTDASLEIGAGHVMRCLSLAGELRSRGVRTHFLCREFSGHLVEKISREGHGISLLSRARGYERAGSDPVHAAWLGVSWQDDAKEVINCLDDTPCEWLIVDHYALDYRWHRRLRSRADCIMVIDDLADRQLDCDLLLDQTYGRPADGYRSLVPAHCRLLLSSEYALLRPGFARKRPMAKKRRAHAGAVHNVLVSMGGMDPDNVTASVLQALDRVEWPHKVMITVVLGAVAPHLEEVREIARRCRQPVKLLSDVDTMDELMLHADLAVGSGGTTNWERCTLGLPAVIVVTADNQELIAAHLHEEGAVLNLGAHGPLSVSDIAEAVGHLVHDENRRTAMSVNAMRICDGAGLSRVCEYLL